MSKIKTAELTLTTGMHFDVETRKREDVRLRRPA